LKRVAVDDRVISAPETRLKEGKREGSEAPDREAVPEEAATTRGILIAADTSLSPRGGRWLAYYGLV